MPIEKTSEEWANSKGVLVIDPDGWDRTRFDASWNELITEEEFNRRLQLSTMMSVRRRN